MPNSLSKTYFSDVGFTLVELLVVISLVGVLAGVTISIINPLKQRKIAEDNVKMSNLQKLALGIEAYNNANGAYPTTLEMRDNNNDGIPDGTRVQVFISRLPNNEPTVGTIYSYYVSGDSFSVSVPKSDSSSNECYKYRSSWGKIKICASRSCQGEGVVSENDCK